MGLSASTVAASIAALSISGVSIADLDEVSDTVDPRACPRLEPSLVAPDFWTDYSQSEDAFGSGTDSLKTITYLLNYKYYHAPVGEGRFLRAHFQAMVEKVEAIFDVLHANDSITGAIDLRPAALPSLGGGVFDPAGRQFHGCVITLRVTEFSEV
jgi:hypothetical protein